MSWEIWVSAEKRNAAVGRACGSWRGPCCLLQGSFAWPGLGGRSSASSLQLPYAEGLEGQELCLPVLLDMRCSLS